MKCTLSKAHRVYLFSIVASVIWLNGCLREVNSSQDGTQAILIGCWEIDSVDSRGAIGHRINISKSDSVTFTSTTIVFTDGSIESAKSEVEIVFKKWKFESDSIYFQNGYGNQRITFADSSIKEVPISGLNEQFLYGLSGNKLTLNGHWLTDTGSKYDYKKCEN